MSNIILKYQFISNVIITDKETTSISYTKFEGLFNISCDLTFEDHSTYLSTESDQIITTNDGIVITID